MAWDGKICFKVHIYKQKFCRCIPVHKSHNSEVWGCNSILENGYSRIGYQYRRNTCYYVANLMEASYNVRHAIYFVACKYPYKSKSFCCLQL